MIGGDHMSGAYVLLYIAIVVLIVGIAVWVRVRLNREQRAAEANAPAVPDEIRVKRDGSRVALVLVALWPAAGLLGFAASNMTGAVSVALNAMTMSCFIVSLVWIFGAPWHRPSRGQAR